MLPSDTGYQQNAKQKTKANIGEEILQIPSQTKKRKTLRDTVLLLHQT
jgi:hypothetical protein